MNKTNALILLTCLLLSAIAGCEVQDDCPNGRCPAHVAGCRCGCHQGGRCRPGCRCRHGNVTVVGPRRVVEVTW